MHPRTGGCIMYCWLTLSAPHDPLAWLGMQFVKLGRALCKRYPLTWQPGPWHTSRIIREIREIRVVII